MFTINIKGSQGGSILICNLYMNACLHDKNESQGLQLEPYFKTFLDHINTSWHFYNCYVYYLDFTDLNPANAHRNSFFFLDVQHFSAATVFNMHRNAEHLQNVTTCTKQFPPTLKAALLIS